MPASVEQRAELYASEVLRVMIRDHDATIDAQRPAPDAVARLLRVIHEAIAGAFVVGFAAGQESSRGRR